MFNRKIIFILVMILLFNIVVVYSKKEYEEKSTEIEGNYYAMLLDGEGIKTLPDAGVYLVDYTCDNNSQIDWDRENGKLSISKNTSVTEKCTVIFKTNPLISEVEQGSYVAYEGNNGCLKDGQPTANVSSSGNGLYENSNSCLGYNANGNSDGSKDSTNGMYGYCGSSYYRYYVSGWRVAYIKDNRAYIVSAASPECTTRTSSTGNGTYITDANLDAKKYCNSSYVDSCTSDEDVHAINDTDYNLIISQSLNQAGGYLYDKIDNATSCGGVRSTESCGYNNDLIDNGGYYWFASKYSDTSENGVYWSTYNRYINNDSRTTAYGLRPVIRFSQDVYVTKGSGTIDDPYQIANK